MSRESPKAAYELTVFLRFADRANLSIDRSSIAHGDATRDEPDFLCRLSSGELVGFELGRLNNPDLAKAENHWEPINGEYIRTRDYSPDTARKKLSMHYSVSHPVELILHKEYPQTTPDNVALPALVPLCREAHSYRRVWFMGDTVQMLYERG